MSAAAEGAPRASRRRPHPLSVLGLLLILGGVGVLGWLAWTIFGTTWVAHRQQADTVRRLETAWRASSRQPGDAGRHGGSGNSANAVGADAILRIPALGADYAVPIVEGVSEEKLSEGVGHFKRNAGPGQRGNFALAGHRITHGQPFARLPDLRPGDRVLVDTRRARYVYRLDTPPAALRVYFTAGWVLDPRPRNPSGGIGPVRTSRYLLTMATCAELFHTDDRLVGFGHLVRVIPMRRLRSTG